MFSSNTSQVADGGYQISRSLRFNSADSAYLSRTPSSAGNRRTWTWSGWVKRNSLGTFQHLFSHVTGATGQYPLSFSDADELSFYIYTGSFTANKTTTQVFRDTSAWYHIVATWDTTNATAADRMRLYVNGSRVTAFSASVDPALNLDSQINNTVEHGIGTNTPFKNTYANFYMTEVNFIDGQALTPSSFGETNAQTGVWQPKAYAGSYGTNGFYLNFSDNSNTTAATLGKDYSGNGNNWTPNNFSVAAGAGNDSLVDTPTPYGVDTGAGGNVRGNYCTWNFLAADSSATITNGNLDVATAAAGVGQARGTIGVSSGKWYWEVTRTTSGANLIAGIVDSATGPDKYPGQTSGSYGYYGLDGTKINNGSFSAYGASYGIGDVIGVALDLDAGTLVFYKNGTSQGTAFTGLSGTFFPAASDDTGGAGMNYVGNFGQRPFAYTAPSGFKALCTQNLPTPTIGATTATQAGQYFTPVLYTGDGTNNRTISAGMTPDLVWIKSRSSAFSQALFDSVRGAGNYLSSNSTGQENYAGSLGWTNSGPTSGGFKVDQGTNGSINQSSSTFVAWGWKANGSGVTNTAGSITSTVSANTTSGCSVVNWTGSTSTSSQTVGHGLGVAPSFVVMKNRNLTDNWFVWHSSFSNLQRNYLSLNTTAAVGTAANDLWGAGMTSTVVGIRPANVALNTSDQIIMYCFAEVPGYSRFGSYTGNGSSDGPFVFTGFRPAYVMIKSTGNPGDQGNWVVKDKLRAAQYNPQDGNLYSNLSNAEDTASTVYVDLLSNGFKIRGTYNGVNASGETYIFAAFAESPFKYALAR